MMKVFSLLFFCLLACFRAGGQSAYTEPDSLTIAGQFQQWLRIEMDHRQQPDQVMLDRYAFLAAQKKWTNLEMAISRELGVFYRETGQPDAAQFWFHRFFNLTSEKGDSLGIALALAHLGNNCMAQGDHKNALEYNLTALGIRLRHQGKEEPVRIANSYMFAGVSLVRMKRYEEAAAFYQKSLDIRLKQTDSTGYALLLANMGGLELMRGNFAVGQRYYDYSFNFRNERRSLCNRATFYLDRGEALVQAGKSEQALILLDSCLMMFDSCHRPRKHADALFEKGKILLAKGKFTEAEPCLMKAVGILKKRAVYQQIADIYLCLFQHSLQNKQTDRAASYFNQYETFKDSMIIRRNERSLSRLQIQQELVVKNAAIDSLNRQNEARTRQRNLLLIGLAAAALILAMAYALNRARKRAYERMRQQKRAAEQLLAEKEQLLQDLHAAQKQLIQQEKMAALGQLTAGIAHELNNPLNFIINNAETLRLDYEEQKGNLTASEKSSLDQEITQLISGIERGGQRMKNIVQELSLFSRNEIGEMEPVHLSVILDEAIHLLQIRGSKPWAVRQTLPDPLPEMHGYSGKLVQLFSNLISNAFDALESRWGENTEQGLLQIDVKNNQEHLRITFRDNGAGMTEEAASKLFDPFYTTKPVGKGTGLGLSIGFAIAKAHRGHIEVESTLGTGTSMTVVLPKG
ncbi:MAG: hypothetical protein JNJ57_18760 [Saprospiraceae bacterium]|nr:hypothetical protein [Saprospiraceae bacterium]